VPGKNERDGEDRDRNRDDQDRELTQLWQQVLREDLRHRKSLRDICEYHERILGKKVRQLRIERGWTQEQLAEKLNEAGWPMHQTTVAKIEAGTRPIRVAEADALALAFGLPIEAMWYLPIAGEPWSMTAMKDRLKMIDDLIGTLEGHLRTTVITYAEQQSERMRLAQAMNEAAKAADRGEPEDLHLSPEESRGFVEAMDDRRPRDDEAMLALMKPEARAAYKQMYDTLNQINSGELNRLAGEAWRLYQATAQDTDAVVKFLAQAMPPGILDPMRAAQEIVQGAFGAAPETPQAAGQETR
jgi:transcriptional regulator with XRE-family HTH domain